jgi:hypothetical protein
VVQEWGKERKVLRKMEDEREERKERQKKEKEREGRKYVVTK